MKVVLVGAAFGTFFGGIAEGDDLQVPVAFIGTEALLEVELLVGDFEDLGDDPSR